MEAGQKFRHARSGNEGVIVAIRPDLDTVTYQFEKGYTEPYVKHTVSTAKAKETLIPIVVVKQKRHQIENPTLGTRWMDKIYTLNGWVDLYPPVKEIERNPWFHGHTKADVDDAYQKGIRFAEGKLAELESARKSTLNELYHDRSRLENVVKNSVGLFNGILDGLKADIENGFLKDPDRTWDYMEGKIKQFVKSNE